MGFTIQDGVLEKYTEEKYPDDVFVPDGVRYVGDFAFQSCRSLSGIRIREHEERPGGWGLLSGHSDSFDVILPGSITGIGIHAFSGCGGLYKVILPGGVTTIEHHAFAYCRFLNRIVLPERLTSIGRSAFRDCIQLEAVSVPVGVKCISESLFDGCIGLKTVTLPDGLLQIGEGAFSNCFSLDAVTLPDGLQSIGARAFYHCYALAEVILPDSVTEIGDEAVSGDTRLICQGVALQNASGVTLQEMVSMVRNRAYDVQMSEPVKSDILWQMFCLYPEDAELMACIRKRFSKMFRFAIRNGRTEVVRAVCRHGQLLTKRNIDKFIDLALVQKQTEIQVLLMDHKNEHIGYDPKKLSL